MPIDARKQVVLVTGAGGEVGNGLIHRLARGAYDILALDLKELDADTAAKCHAKLHGDVLDKRLLERLVSEYEIHTIFQALACSEMWLLRAPCPVVAHRNVTFALRAKGRRSSRCKYDTKNQLRQALNHSALQALQVLAIHR